MTYHEYVRTEYLPKVIDEYVILTAHADKLKVHLRKMAWFGCPDYDSEYYYNKMLGIIAVYRDFLSKAK